MLVSPASGDGPSEMGQQPPAAAIDKTNVNIDEGVEALDLGMRLIEARKSDAAYIEIGHLPPNIRNHLGALDADGSGRVGVGDLAAAIHAYKSSQGGSADQAATKLSVDQAAVDARKTRGAPTTKGLLLGLACAVLLLMVSTYFLSWAAVETARDLHPGKDGVLKTSGGVVVITENSDFEARPDGSLKRRGASRRLLDCGEDRRCLAETSLGGNLKISAHSDTHEALSTLPDSAFVELKHIVLTNGEHTLKVGIHSFQRMKLSTSKCGSVVHLFSNDGRLTLDEGNVEADPKFQAFMHNAGMPHLLQSFGKFGALVEPLGTTATGYFNSLEDVTPTCEPSTLAHPEDLPQLYVAYKMEKATHREPHPYASALFTDAHGRFPFLPGLEPEGRSLDPYVEAEDIANERGRAVVKVWEEVEVRGGDIKASLRRYAAYPFQEDVVMKYKGVEVMMEKLDQGSDGLHCRIGQSEKADPVRPISQRAAFVGIAVEDGIVLRHYKINMSASLGSNTSHSAANVVKTLMQSGDFPDTLHYFDVDHDPSGKFASGMPYMVVRNSSVIGATTFHETRYLSIQPLASALDPKGALTWLNITGLDKPCKEPKKTGVPVKSPELDEVRAYMSHLSVTRFYNSSTLPPKVQPWTEHPDSVLYNFQKLQHAWQSGTVTPGVALALATPYWQTLLGQSHNWQAASAATNLTSNGSRTTGPRGRRLDAADGLSSGGRDAPAAEPPLAEGEDSAAAAAEARRLWWGSSYVSSAVSYVSGRRRRRRRAPSTSKFHYSGSFSWNSAAVNMKIKDAQMALNAGFSRSGLSSISATASTSRSTLIYAAGALNIYFKGVSGGIPYTPFTCSSECTWPTCNHGSSSNGGSALSDGYRGTCSQRCSQKYGSDRYCGSGSNYEEWGSIDCSPCAATKVNGYITWSFETCAGPSNYCATFSVEIGGEIQSNEHGIFLAEVYGKGTLDYGKLSGWGKIDLTTQSPWNTHYKKWQACIYAGYSLDLYVSSYSGSYTIGCTTLNFR